MSLRVLQKIMASNILIMDCTTTGGSSPAYGHTREEAVARVKALSLRVLAERMENGR
jgi:hypothetical protein